jgi:hypothetical protein
MVTAWQFGAWAGHRQDLPIEGGFKQDATPVGKLLPPPTTTVGFSRDERGRPRTVHLALLFIIVSAVV